MFEILQRCLLAVIVLGLGVVLMTGVGLKVWASDYFRSTAPEVWTPAAPPSWRSAFLFGAVIAVISVAVLA